MNNSLIKNWIIQINQTMNNLNDQNDIQEELRNGLMEEAKAFLSELECLLNE